MGFVIHHWHITLVSSTVGKTLGWTRAGTEGMLRHGCQNLQPPLLPVTVSSCWGARERRENLEGAARPSRLVPLRFNIKQLKHVSL